MVQRSPTVEEAEEIFKLTLLLYSYSEDVPTYKLSDFFTVQVNLFSSFVTTAPLFISSKPPMIFGCISKMCMIPFTLDPLGIAGNF